MFRSQLTQDVHFVFAEKKIAITIFQSIDKVERYLAISS